MFYFIILINVNKIYFDSNTSMKFITDNVLYYTSNGYIIKVITDLQYMRIKTKSMRNIFNLGEGHFQLKRLIIFINRK